MFGSYDISFCSYKDCKDKKCRRNQYRLKDYPYPVSIMDFPECEKWVNGEHAIDTRFRGDKMSKDEFIEKMRALDLVFSEGKIPLERLYGHFETIVREMERLEDIEDNTAQMQACIDGLRETVRELQEQLKMYEPKTDGGRER